VNTTEFFVTTAAAATFFVALGSVPIYELSALVIGGVVAAPFGGWIVKHIQPRLLMTVVGFVVVGLALWQLVRSLPFI
jgi:uncharacterized protein